MQARDEGLWPLRGHTFFRPKDDYDPRRSRHFFEKPPGYQLLGVGADEDRPPVERVIGMSLEADYRDLKVKAEKMAAWIISHEEPASTKSMIDRAMDIVDRDAFSLPIPAHEIAKRLGFAFETPERIPAKLRYEDGQEDHVELIGVPKIEYVAGMGDRLAGMITCPSLGRCEVVEAHLTFEDTSVYGVFEIDANITILPPHKITAEGPVICRFRSIGPITSDRVEGK